MSISSTYIRYGPSEKLVIVTEFLQYLSKRTHKYLFSINTLSIKRAHTTARQRSVRSAYPPPEGDWGLGSCNSYSLAGRSMDRLLFEMLKLVQAMSIPGLIVNTANKILRPEILFSYQFNYLYELYSITYVFFYNISNAVWLVFFFFFLW